MSKPKEHSDGGLLLSALIDQVIAKKTGNKEFALFYEDPGWRAEIGNPVTCVSLGESVGTFFATGDTPEEAVGKLLQELP